MKVLHFPLLPKVDFQLRTDSFLVHFPICTMQRGMSWSYLSAAYLVLDYWQDTFSCQVLVDCVGHFLHCRLELWIHYSLQGWDILLLA